MAKGYTFLRWNKKYGSAAQFVVKDNENDKQSVFSPSRPSDVAWSDKDLANSDDYKNWDTFGDEKVDDLSKVVF